MKTAILLANIGNSDLGIGEESIFSSKNTSFTGNAYEDSKKRWELGDYKDLDLPILEPTIKKIKESFEIQEIILFGTEQLPVNKQDTIYIALICKKIICERYNFDEDKVKVSTIFKNPTDYKKLLRFYQQEAGKIQKIVDQIFVSTTGGTPQTNLSLMLQMYRRFGEKVKMVYKPRSEKEAIIYEFNFEEKKDTVKIGTVQIAFELSDSFPPEIIDKEATRDKVFKALDVASKENVDIVCLPELCICEYWLFEIEKQYPELITIAGSYYDKEGHNVCRVIIDSDQNLLPPQFKITPSEFEDSSACGLGMVPGEKINTYHETPFGKFAVLICRDFGNFCSDFKKRSDIDILFVPSFNSANRRFHQDAHAHVENSLSYVIISNTAKYGGTAIFGRMKDSYFPGLISKGFKQKDDRTFKLCELNEGVEGIIIADFNLKYKSFLVPAPMNPDMMSLPVENIKVVNLEGKKS